ncbi:helix-turn-helix domain-containing protein [Morganella morganii]|uniref:helix-turn-helix domain-containing protein n=1 Tax=Morganella morganii TaxID=582 RepID=UPI0028072EC8|nr:helix-turn-helix domain-containing protein [Morganella morganii]
MITDTAKAINAAKDLVAAVPFLGGNSSEKDYRDALGLMDYLIECDDENPLIGFLAGKIADYEDTCEDFAEFNNSVTETAVGVALLRTLIDQYKLSYSDLKNEIGSKSLVSQILSGKRALTISHIKALSARFGIRPEWFL